MDTTHFPAPDRWQDEAKRSDLSAQSGIWSPRSSAHAELASTDGFDDFDDDDFDDEFDDEFEEDWEDDFEDDDDAGVTSAGS